MPGSNSCVALGKVVCSYQDAQVRQKLCILASPVSCQGFVVVCGGVIELRILELKCSQAQVPRNFLAVPVYCGKSELKTFP
jgi:hypothetical protein